MRKLSISYNKIKGNIPSSIKNLKNLKLFHLHSNQLNGDADLFGENQKLESFIADCGSTDLIEKLVTCATCTECCNEEGGCITLINTWPDPSLKELKTKLSLDPAYAILLLILGCWIVLLFTSFVVSF